VLNIVGTWMDPVTDAESNAWVRDLWGHVEPHTVAAYTNFLGEEGADRVRSAFDDSAWQRLVELKRQWDPETSSGRTRTSRCLEAWSLLSCSAY
jgi:hypothetical protein